MAQVKIKKSENKPETTEILADAVVRISDALTVLLESGLNTDAIVILIAAKTKLSKRSINTVLSSLKQLRGWYCKRSK